ncbi:class I SAM-dependent methyltransferase [Myxococcota bacterium]|nr:class I SAM-dependent methyltransferase [Myxococcota bacterium]MBU1537577.1 class I SAM-dependent methyltransferase [Myxococcota bacterium]
MNDGWGALLEEAIGFRLGESFAGADVWRLLHARKSGEGDLRGHLLPLEPHEGLIIDKYGSAVVITAFQGGFEPLRLRGVLSRHLPVESLYYQPRFETWSTMVPPSLIWGSPRGPFVAAESRLRCLIDLERGFNPGIFLDTRPVRRYLEQGALRGMRVLNLFSYTCTMGICAMLGGAIHAVNVDSSRSSLNRGRENYAINGLRVDNRDFVRADVFSQLGYYQKKGMTFDAVVCDPPPRLPGRGDAVFQYELLWKKIEPVIGEGGIAIIITRDMRISADTFSSMFRPDGRLMLADRDLNPRNGSNPLFKAVVVKK